MFGKNRSQESLASGRAIQARKLRTAHCPLPTAHSQRHRRGVLLLVVLSVLVLFLMIGTAFIISAKHADVSGKANYKGAVRTATAAAQGKLLDEVVLQLIRDTRNQSSTLRFHSLLADMYGADGFQAAINNAEWAGGSTNATGGQMIQLELGAGSIVDLYGVSVVPKTTPPMPAAQGEAQFLSPLDNAYNGLVLTFVNGPVAGQSTRIVGYRPPNPAATPPTNAMITVMAPPLPGGGTLTDPNLLDAQSNFLARILINGRPFSGTGFGLNSAVMASSSAQPRLTLREMIMGTRRPVALLPNHVYFDPTQLVQTDFGSPSMSLSPPFVLSPTQQGALSGNTTNAVQQRAALALHIGPAGIGGAHESYDVPDYQNMALALVPGADTLVETVLADAAATGPLPTVLAANGNPMVLPSFHRPELLNYWKNIPGTNLATNAMLLRRVMLRPSWYDHPNFSGSNPDVAPHQSAFAAAVASRNTAQMQANSGPLLNRMIYGPWDVDNDNDGVRDSIWMDFGAPVIALPGGKLVKPLAAVLCVDMDGKLNVNAHGSLDLADDIPEVQEMLRLADGTENAPENDDTPRGSGWGPADASLEIALGEDFRRLLIGDTVRIGGQDVALPGRYGVVDNDEPRPRPGRGSRFDILSQVSLFGWPDRANWLTKYATPPDLRARYGAGVNVFGQPVFEATLGTLEVPGELQDPNGLLISDSPYELNLSRSAVSGVTASQNSAAADMPFSIAELERVLRVYDADAGALPARLAYLAGIQRPDGSTSPGFTDRLKLTTDSVDLPAPNVALPPVLRNTTMLSNTAARLPRSVGELIEIRVRTALARKNDDTPRAKYKKFPEPIADAAATAEVRGIVRQLLAPELADGLRLDINRPFGNGWDDDDDGAVDEAGEEGNVWMWPQVNKLTAGLNMGGADSTATDAFKNPRFPIKPPDFAKDGTLKPMSDRVDHRALLARHLYCLALTVTADAKYADGSSPEDDAELARRMAQFAANAVDFRDADNAMMLFEYDINPFDGWDVDGQVGGGSQDDTGVSMRGLVAGTERPELLMTETLSWHDRRTDDSAQAAAWPSTDDPDTTTSEVTRPDQDFDSLTRPRGAFFLEVHNPWPSSASAGADLHAVDTRGNARIDKGVNLAAVAVDPNDPNKRSPVWRFAVYKRRDINVEDAALWDPDNHDPEKRPPGGIDRSIYLAGFDPEYPDDGTAFFNDSARNPAPPVRPGRYLVIGSGDERAPGVYETPIGDRKGARNPNDPDRNKRRRIELITRNEPHKVRMIDAVTTVNGDEGVIEDITVNPPENRYLVQAPAETSIQSAAAPGQQPLAQPAYENDPSRCVTDVAIIDQVSDGAGGKTRRRLSLSEPATGYPNRFRGSIWNPDKDQYENADGQLMAIDVPLDGPIGGEEKLSQPPPIGYGPISDGNWPTYLAQFNQGTRRWQSLVDPVLTQIRNPQSNTNPDEGASYAFIYLQRLADPTMPWNPEPGQPGHDENQPVNPYKTVDSTTANLTVFNSRGDDRGYEEGGERQANDAGARFASHERGYSQAVAAATDPQNAPPPTLWTEEAASAVRMRPARLKLKQLPTRANRFFMPGAAKLSLQDTQNYWFNRVPYCSLGFMNKPFEDQARRGEERQLVPDDPFPWFAWNNRPYMSSKELLLVPRVRSSQLLEDFAIARGEDPDQGPSPYTTPLLSELEDPPQPIEERPAFAHLENFFFEGPMTAAKLPPPRGEQAATAPTTEQLRKVPNGLYHLLEYVQTPSLFAGTQTWLNPGNFQNPTGLGATPISDPYDPRLFRQAPFNTISEFRDPGRVNINTIFSSDVWQGLFHGNSKRDSNDWHAGPDFDDQFVISRRGYGDPTVDSALLMDKDYPTFFANPVRSPDAGELVPSLNGNSSRLVRAGIDCTLLRSIEPKLLSGSPAKLQADGIPLFSATTEADYNDAGRHAYFRYRPMTRLDNLVTTRSNVYAVWVTIGFFEVEPAPSLPTFNTTNGTSGPTGTALYNRVYPDGYALGREAGVDTGETRRMRGFYIIDRSLPVAFEPGTDHNVENTIRLRRRIE